MSNSQEMVGKNVDIVVASKIEARQKEAGLERELDHLNVKQ
jgi:hypothetical protein